MSKIYDISGLFRIEYSFFYLPEETWILDIFPVVAL